MSAQLAILLAAVVACSQAASTGKCDVKACASGALRHLHHYYEELDCKAVMKEGECCPASYDCSHMETRDKSRCYFKGKELAVRPLIEEIDPAACLAGCFCRQTKEAGAVASLTCANVECPTLFNPSLIPEGCVATYSSDRCCSDGVLCTQNVTAETAKCEWSGRTYLEGQKFYPDEEPCKTCICQKGFNGSLDGPWCKQVTCGLELHYTGRLARGCAPVFHEKSKCCPIEWRCPSDEDVVVAAVTSKNPAGDASSGATCRWGTLTLKQGETVSSVKGDGMCKRCTCDLPPHVTCETDGQPCAPEAPVTAEPLPVAAAEGPEAPVVDAAKVRKARDSKLTCANVRCVRRCVMRDGHPHCE